MTGTVSREVTGYPDLRLLAKASEQLRRPERTTTMTTSSITPPMPEPAPQVPRPEPAPIGLARLLSRAHEVDTPQARALIATIERAAQRLEVIVRSELEVAPLSAEIAQLEQQLADARRKRRALTASTPTRKATGVAAQWASGEAAACRAWCKANGVEVNAKGAPNRAAMTAWRAATGGAVES